MRLNLRRAAIAGGAMALVLPAAIAARSPTPFQTFLYVLAVVLAMGLIGMAILVAIDRRGRRHSED